MPEKRWKWIERWVARMLGGTRNVEKGIPQPDVEGPDFVAQVKDRKRLPDYVIFGLADAKLHAATRKKRFPLLVLSTPTMRAKIVCMEHTDFLKLWRCRYSYAPEVRPPVGGALDEVAYEALEEQMGEGGPRCLDGFGRISGKRFTESYATGTAKRARNAGKPPRR